MNRVILTDLYEAYFIFEEIESFLKKFLINWIFLLQDLYYCMNPLKIEKVAISCVIGALTLQESKDSESVF